VYNYKAKVDSVVDGDTVWFLIDLGFDLTLRKKLRFANIDAPELKNVGGKEAKEYLAQSLPVGKEVILVSKKTLDKYGRFVATVMLDGKVTATVEGKDLNKDMLDSGHAKAFMDH
jgi:micrococcal nuclease